MANKRVLKAIARGLSEIRGVIAIIVYGSYARGDQGRKSDVDILILVDDKADKNQIEDAVIDLENRVARSIQPTIRTRKEMDKTDSGLLQNIFQEGKVLYSREPLDLDATLILGRKPFVLFTFELRNLSQKEKTRLNRKLYPHVTRGYRYTGFLQQIGGERLGSGCLLVPHGKKARLEAFFRRSRIRFREMSLWR